MLKYNLKEEAIYSYRTIFISDIHLGTRSCQAEYLLEFIKYTNSEKLYLIGDIIDGWALKKSWYWPQTHNDVIQKLLRKAKKGTDVKYIAGNHDEIIRKFIPITFGHIKIYNQYVHKTKKGKKYLIIHGDQFDGIMQYAKWISIIGSTAYEWLIKMNSLINYFRKKMGKEYWSLSKYIKFKVKNAVNYISHYEELISQYAKKRGADGVICGHIHHAEIKNIGKIDYLNDGDWVESCSAIVEHFSGEFEIINWIEQRKNILEIIEKKNLLRKKEVSL
tara:strand:- start:6655 stop:7482 length:828 start_codon:yes stop_codon:yes gene_type:complete